MAVTQISYKDGTGASKTANAGSDGTNTTTGVTLFDSSGAYLSALTVGGTTVVVNNQITRPANTTQYTVGDVVNDNSTTTFAFANATRIAAGSGSVLGARMIANSTVTTSASFRLWVFNASPGALTDNAVYSMTYAQRSNRLGYFDFTSPIAGSDCVEFIGSNAQAGPIGFKLPSGTTLYGVLLATGAYTPTSGETIDIYLQIAQD